MKELAPALLALGDLFDRTNQVVNKGRASVSLNVKRFPSGSFGVELNVIQTIVDQVRALFADFSLADAGNLAAILGLLGGTTRGLFWLIKRSKGKKPQRAVRLESGAVRLEFEGFSEEVEQPVFDVFRDLAARAAAEQVLKPLTADGVDSFKVEQNSVLVQSVTKQEVDYFAAPTVEDEKLQEDTTIRVLAIISLNFKDDRKWRFTDGDTEFWATISDVSFIIMVDQNAAAFCKGDRLTVKLKTTQWDTSRGLKKEYEIVEVLEHRSAARQLKLPIA
ncbi:MAG: hypothetical protein V1797_19455 [Pseudomonadota bacterium]